MNKISVEKDDELYQHAMFSDALGENYLGSPAVVGGMIAVYCLAVRDMLVQRAAGTLESTEFVARVNEMCAEMSVIFSGNDDEFKPLIGRNAISLGARLKVALGSYWQENRESHGDDPIKVLFAWLCWGVFDAMERSNGDEDLEGVILSDRTESAIRLLLGTDRRT